MKSRKKRKFNTMAAVPAGILIILLMMLFFKNIPEYRNAARTGRILGSEEGRKVGMYVGSSLGTRDGLAEIDNPELTSSELTSKLSEIFSETGKFNILTSAVNSEYSQNSSGVSTGYTAVFTLDYSNARAESTGDKLILITIPDPECVIYNTASNTADASGEIYFSDSVLKEARRLAKAHTEEIADIVCGQLCTCTVSFAEGGDADE